MIAPRPDVQPASPAGAMRLRWWPHALALASVPGITLAAIGPLWLAATLALMLGWFLLPGIVLGRVLYRGQAGAGGAALLLGPVWGFALSSLVLLALWLAGVRAPFVLLGVAPLPAIGVAVAAGLLVGPLSPPRLGRRDLTAVVLVLLLVPLVVARPYSRVAADVPDGRAYRAYFTADFVWTMAVVAELSKGDVPPRNQFLHNRDLHYYWLPHLLSAVQYRHLAPRASLESVLLMNGALFGLALTAFLYGFSRQFLSSPAGAALGCTGAVLFTSFEGLERLIVHWRQGIPLEALRNVNIDAATRWYYGALPVDGLQRLLLYQPQHHAMAYAAGLSALLLLVQAREPGRPRLMLLVGALLGAGVLLSAFSAIMLTVMAAVYVLVVLAGRRQWGAILPCAAAGAAPLAAAVGAAFALSYVDRSGSPGSIVEIIANPMAFTRTWFTLLLSFGPMLLLGSAGLLAGSLRRTPGFLALGVIVAVSFAFYFFVNVRDHQYVYVGWRAGHFLFIAFAPLAGYALQRIWQAGGVARATGMTAAALLALAAAPTTVIDLYNTQDIENRSLGPSFRWTTVLTHDEVDALAWIRERTPPDAIVQVEPHVRRNFTWAYVPAFAERRMAAGLPISMVPLSQYEAASRRILELYTAADAQAAYDLAAGLRIDYLIVGPPEREAYQAFEPMVDGRPDLFRPMFRNATMTIYFLEGGFRAPTKPQS
jgi:hypothetical protein